MNFVVNFHAIDVIVEISDLSRFAMLSLSCCGFVVSSLISTASLLPTTLSMLFCFLMSWKFFSFAFIQPFSSHVVSAQSHDVLRHHLFDPCFRLTNDKIGTSRKAKISELSYIALFQINDSGLWFQITYQ